MSLKTFYTARRMAEALNTLGGMIYFLEHVAGRLDLYDREDWTFRFAEICENLGTAVGYYQAVPSVNYCEEKPHRDIRPEDAVKLARVRGEVFDYFSALKCAMSELCVLWSEIASDHAVLPLARELAAAAERGDVAEVICRARIIADSDERRAVVEKKAPC